MKREGKREGEGGEEAGRRQEGKGRGRGRRGKGGRGREREGGEEGGREGGEEGGRGGGREGKGGGEEGGRREGGRGRGKSFESGIELTIPNSLLPVVVFYAGRMLLRAIHTVVGLGSGTETSIFTTAQRVSHSQTPSEGLGMRLSHIIIVQVFLSI